MCRLSFGVMPRPPFTPAAAGQRKVAGDASADIVDAMADPSAPRHDFAGLYRVTVEPLRRCLARFLGDPAEAQAIAPDAYLRVWPAVQQDAARKPEALLYTTARRLALNRLKRRRIAPVAGTCGAGISTITATSGSSSPTRPWWTSSARRTARRPTSRSCGTARSSARTGPTGASASEWTGTTTTRACCRSLSVTATF